MHRDLDIEFPEHDEPMHIPTGDECEHAARGENCGRTDCYGCGKDALSALSKKARAGVDGLIDFAREVIRTEGARGRYTPTLGMLARLRDIKRPATTPAAQFYRRYASRRAFAWAEGIIDAVDKNPWMVSGDFDDQIDEQAAYMVGRLLVELHLVNENLTKLEAQRASEVALADEIIAEIIAEEREAQAMADADITSAAAARVAAPVIPA